MTQAKNQNQKKHSKIRGKLRKYESARERTRTSDLLYANAHWGKMRKAGQSPFVLRMDEEDKKCIPSKGWAAMIRKVYEVDPMLCPKCGGTMKVVVFITDHQAVDRIIRRLKLTFVAEKPPPPRVVYQEVFMAAAPRPQPNIFHDLLFSWKERSSLNNS